MNRNEEVLMSMLLDMANDMPLYIKKWVVDKLYPCVRANSKLYIIDQYGLFDPSVVNEVIDPILDSLALIHDVAPEYVPDLLELDVEEMALVVADFIEKIVLMYNNLPIDD